MREKYKRKLPSAMLYLDYFFSFYFFSSRPKREEQETKSFNPQIQFFPPRAVQRKGTLTNRDIENAEVTNENGNSTSEASIDKIKEATT